MTLRDYLRTELHASYIRLWVHGECVSAFDSLDMDETDRCYLERYIDHEVMDKQHIRDGYSTTEIYLREA